MEMSMGMCDENMRSFQNLPVLMVDFQEKSAGMIVLDSIIGGDVGKDIPVHRHGSVDTEEMSAEKIHQDVRFL